jgi:hypothetical protein
MWIPNVTLLREPSTISSRGCKILYNCGVASFAGQLSTRLGEDRILIKPRPVT